MRGRRILACGIAAVALAMPVAACGPDEPPLQSVVRVPQDASLQEAGALVADGGLVLIDPGVHHGTLQVSADDVTVRGADRETVVLDGELTNQHGVMASGARITVENLTVQNYLQNGVLVTGVTDAEGAGVARGPDGYVPQEVPDPVPGYLVQHVTAANNGLYGIYAFNRTGGIIRDNLVSGGADSGIYVGQCAACNSWITHNTAVSSAVGIELANASEVTISENRIVGNRLGISVLSNYLEAHGPSTSVTIAGNLIADNDNPQTPLQAGGAFGIGIGLAGSVDALLVANRIVDHENVGVWLTSSEDFSPTGSRVEGNTWSGNGLDIAYTLSGNVDAQPQCLVDAAEATTDPVDLVAQCDATPRPGQFALPPAPAGVSFADVPIPAGVPGLEGLGTTPRSLPDVVEIPDVSQLAVPELDFQP